MHRSTLVVVVAILPLLGGISCGGSPRSSSESSSIYLGICAASDQSPYVLPYPVGTTYVVYQGYPPFNHSSSFKFAVDFSMPSRSIVVATRSGEVQYVEESYEDNDFATGHENLVVIDHGDGTFGRYVHMVKNGVLVEPGDQVVRGQSIALSGATGSGVEHLHFDVTTQCSSRNCQTIPVCFANTTPHPNGLQRGLAYYAEPY